MEGVTIEMALSVIGVILSVSFGLWAGVVRWAANAFIARVDDATADLKELDADMREFIRATERRLTMLEAQHDSLKERVEDFCK